MKISNKIISIPPYISAHWGQIKSIHSEEQGSLVFSLQEGKSIAIPHLTVEEKQQIFLAHASYLEEDIQPSVAEKGAQFAVFMQSLLGENFRYKNVQTNLAPLEGITSLSEHNPAQFNAPNLPPEVLEKIASVVKMIAPSDPALLPKAEQRCNCFHCQVARAISSEHEEPLDEVEPENLPFHHWQVEQVADTLYSVTNSLDSTESYRVYLGEPIGCTCGKSGCEHIVAVLKS